MTASMDWTNLNFKAKDVLIFLVYVITAAFFVSRMQSSVERLSDKTLDLSTEFKEFKDESKIGGKEYEVLIQNIQNQVNLNSTQIMLLKQDMEQVKSRK